MTRNRMLAGLLAAAVVVSCGGDGGGTQNNPVPTPGNLTVSLDPSASAGAGAIQFTVTGGTKAIDTVVAAPGYTAYVRRVNAGQFRVILIGNVVSGAMATVHVPDTKKAASYSVAATGAANDATFAAMSALLFPLSLDAP
ncbi:MAG TPA: hypothetical protein VJN95_02480 [Gemmatimonadales bacterium]|nr:hypothetical protein [Gemmatimonadales bacterium]